MACADLRQPSSGVQTCGLLRPTCAEALDAEGVTSPAIVLTSAPLQRPPAKREAPERRLGQSHDVSDSSRIPAAFSWIGIEHQGVPAGLKLFSKRIAADPSGRAPPHDGSDDASRTTEAHHPTRDDVRFRNTGVDRRMAVMGAQPKVRFCARS
jgi:hypothetical protein